MSADRIAAISTRAGPQVVSCISTRPGKNGNLLFARSVLEPSQDSGGIPVRFVPTFAQDVFEQDAENVRKPIEIGPGLRGQVNDTVAAPALTSVLNRFTSPSPALE